MRSELNKFITIIVGELPPNVTGGAEIFIYNLIKEVSKTRDIVLIGVNDPLIKGVKFYKIRQIRPARLFYPFQLMYVLCKSSFRSSAIYTSFLTGSWLLYIPITLFSVLFRVPYSFTIHGGGLAGWKYKLPYLIFFKKASKITGVSYPICDEYKNRTNIDIKYLPPLIPFLKTTSSRETLRIKYKLPPVNRIILFVGSLKPLKKPLHILYALNLLGIEYIEQNKLSLVIAGDGILKGDISRFAVDNNLTKYIYLMGNLPNESIHELYTVADLYVICSEYEGTPISMLEAMFNSLPIVASDAPGINSILRNDESGLMYKTEDPSELANRLKQLLGDKEKENRIRINANRLFNEKFNYQNIISEYLSIISG